jgi:hypothetical protein
VTIEQYREMDEKIRMEDEEMRMARERELALLKREREEKENVGAGVGGEGGEGEYSVYQSKRQSGLSPRLAARSASTSQIQSQPSSDGLVSRITSAPIPISTSSGRQILPGPNRAGRILMGAKYTAPSSSSAPTTTTTNGTSTANGAGQNGTVMGGFERINEQEPFEDAGDLAGVLDFYGPEETDIGAFFLSSYCLMCFNL